MKIHIMGASCAGSTTLGAALAQQLNYPLFDSDEYFWEKTAAPFSIKRNPELRDAMMARDTANQKKWILSGSLVSWGPEWLGMFDLVVFLYVPHHLRMQRLQSRELERYGNRIFTDPEQAEKYRAFRQWASGYDDNTTNGRNLRVHEIWLSKLNCPVLNIQGDTTVDERIEMILRKMKEMG